MANRGADGKRRCITEFFERAPEKQQQVIAQAVTSEQCGLGGAILGSVKKSVTQALSGKRERNPEPSEDDKRRIGEYSAKFGPARTIDWWKEETGVILKVPTVCKYKNMVQLGASPKYSVNEREDHRGGRPGLLKMAEEEMLMQYLNALRDAGGVVTGKICAASARGIVSALRPYDLKDRGGTVAFSEHWGYDLLKRHDWRWRMRTTGHRHLPDDVRKAEELLHAALCRIAMMYNIPPALFVNCDETANLLIPLTNHTFAPAGAEKVAIAGSEEKRATTLTMGCTPVGRLVPPQMIFPVSTARTLPADGNLPAGWTATFRTARKGKSPSHWANEETVLQYIQSNLVPFLATIKAELGLPSSQKSCVLLDVFRAHLTDKVKEELERNDIVLLTVPASGTDLFQPCDQVVNSKFKQSVKKQFEEYFERMLAAHITGGGPPASFVLDTRLTIIRPRNLEWTIAAWKSLTEKDVRSSWKRAGMAFLQTSSDLDIYSTLRWGCGKFYL